MDAETAGTANRRNDTTDPSESSPAPDPATPSTGPRAETTAASHLSMLNLSFGMARQDSPIYRASLQRIEDEVDRLALWMDALVRSLRSYVDELNRCNECSQQLATKVMPYIGAELIDGDLNLSALRTFSDALQCVFSFKAKLVEDVQDYLLNPIQLFLKDDIKEMRDLRRNQDRISDRYDSALARYASLSKIKEASSLREDAFQLYDVRKSYIKSCMEYTARTIRFKSTIDRLIMDQFMDVMDSIFDFYQNAAEVYKGLKPRIDQLKTSLQQRRVDVDSKLDNLNDMRLQVEEEAIDDCRPSNALPLSNPSASLKPTVGSGTPIERQGYLFKRTQPKSPIVAPTWVRRWCFIQNGMFGYKTLAKQRGAVANANPGSVLLFEVRIDDKQDRRYCFEVISSKKSSLFQAETEEELIAWLQVFEAAKTHALQISKSDLHTSSDNRPTHESKIYMEDEEWDSVTPVSIVQQSKISVSMSNLTPSSRPIKYPDAEFQRRNDELHRLVPSVPTEEFLIDSFPGALQQESFVQGRIYVTPNWIVFYSSILSHINLISISFEQVSGIQRKHNLITVTTLDRLYILKTFYRDDIKTFGLLNTVYWNYQSEKPMNAQELFNLVYSSYRNQPQEELSAAEKDDPGPTAFVWSPKSAASSWPGEIPVPTAEVKCGCADHYERTELNLVLNASAKKVFDLIFGGDSFLLALHKRRGDWNSTVSSWANNHRDIKWYFNVNNPMTKVKETDCVEHQTIMKRDEHVCYVVDTYSRTEHMPFGDSFQTTSRFCIMFVNQQSCRLLLTIGVKFFKHPMIKSIIKSAALKGLGDYCKDFGSFLQEEVIRSSKPQSDPSRINDRRQDPSPAAAKTESKPSTSQQVIGASFQEPAAWADWKIWLWLLLLMSLLLNALQYLQHRADPLQHLTTVRGVYLRDLEESLMNATAQVSTERSLARKKSFLRFLRYYDSYHYKSPSFRKLSVDLQESVIQAQQFRLRVLETFRTLNVFESAVLKLMYVNWLSDQVYWCRLSLEQLSDPESVSLRSRQCDHLSWDLGIFLHTASE